MDPSFGARTTRCACIFAIAAASACADEVSAVDGGGSGDGSSSATAGGSSVSGSASGPTATSVEDTGTPTITAADATTQPGETTATTSEPGGPAVDVLFVVDNSSSMGAAQGRLAVASAELVGMLDALAIDWRIGVTTTDNGNPWCDTSPEAGTMQASTCRARLGEFVAGPIDATTSACLDVCTLDDLPLGSTTTELDAVPTVRPWLEPANLPPAVSAAAALACVLPQGIAGCEFEAPLESAYKAMLRAQLGLEPQYGFLRGDASLLVVIVSDETDCSTATGHESIFLPTARGGDPEVFWSDPTAPKPTSAVCWRAGVGCTGDSPYDECHSTNKDIAGAGNASDDDAVLFPLSRYREFLQQLEEQKQGVDPSNAVLLAVIGGVPPGYPEGVAEIVYADAIDAEIQDELGIGPTCTQSDGSEPSVPAVRERELAAAFATDEGARNLWSICEASYGSAMAGIVAMVAG